MFIRVIRGSINFIIVSPLWGSNLGCSPFPGLRPGLFVCECFALLMQQFIAFTLLRLYWLFRPSNNCFVSHQRIVPIYTNLPNSNFLIQKIKSQIPDSKIQVTNPKSQKEKRKECKNDETHTLYPMPYVPMPLCPMPLINPIYPIYPIHLLPPFTEHKST